MEIKSRDNVIVPGILVVSILVPCMVLVLMFVPENDIWNVEKGGFPLFHAVINFTTALLLVAGFYSMKAQKLKWHRNIMISAFFLSAVFLVSYVISKMNHDPVPYGGEGMLRPIYYFILITHILLSGIIIPLVLFTMYRGLTGETEKHRKIARYTYPIWLYVTVTGVLVYVFMSPYY